ncbi:MAG: toll/interleukin-1 receptor domain-containing protein [Thermomicrobiales bacterium]
MLTANIHEGIPRPNQKRHFSHRLFWPKIPGNDRSVFLEILKPSRDEKPKSTEQPKGFLDNFRKIDTIDIPFLRQHESEVRSASKEGNGAFGGVIFISYRRNDEAGITGRLYDWLSRDFGRDRIFMDVDNIPPGADFVDYLSKQVEGCDVFLAVVGKNWRGDQRPGGSHQIEDKEDFVRIEVAAALKQGKTVIPVLIGDVPHLSSSNLPVSLKALARRQAVRIRHENFGTDVQRLIAALKIGLADTPPRPPR